MCLWHCRLNLYSAYLLKKQKADRLLDLHTKFHLKQTKKKTLKWFLSSKLCWDVRLRNSTRAGWVCQLFGKNLEFMTSFYPSSKQQVEEQTPIRRHLQSPSNSPAGSSDPKSFLLTSVHTSFLRSTVSLRPGSSFLGMERDTRAVLSCFRGTLQSGDMHFTADHNNHWIMCSDYSKEQKGNCE